MTRSEHDLADEELIDRACGGDHSAFEMLMRRYSGPVRGLIARFFRNRTTVDDLAQETFAKAYFSLKSFRKAAPFESWLKRIALRQCLDQVRKRKIDTIPIGEEADEIPDVPVPFDPEAQLKARLLLDKMIQSLSTLDRIIFILHYGEGYSGEEIAEMTGISKANVKIRTFRIRQRLKAIYEGGPSDK